jgi:hypothetical protein
MNPQKFNTIKAILIAFVLTITASQLFAQTTNGIFFQAVARDNFSNPAKDRQIYVESSIIQTTSTGTKVLIELHKTTTDAMGVFNISLGNGARTGGSASSLAAVDWSKGPFFLNLKIAITPFSASDSWNYTKELVDMGTTSFGTVPFALYSANTAKIDNKLNTTDTSKMLEPYAKANTVQTLSAAIDTKLASKDTSVILSSYSRISYVDSSLRTKFNNSDTIKYAKLTYIDSSLLTKMDLFDTSKFAKQIFIDSALSTKLKITDTIKYTKLTYTDSALLIKMNIFDTTRFAKQIFIDSALSTKLKITDTIKYTKLTYTDSALLTKLSLTGNALTATIADNITATTNTTLTSLSNLKTLGIITTGIWSATTIDIAHGGTGLTTAGLSGQALTTSAAGTLTWTNVSELTGAHYIGESFGGGIIFYVYDNGKHGLIVSTEDQGTEVIWYNGTYSTTNAFRDGVNAGLLNTERIILSQGAGNYAAQIAANYKGGGFGDWYLPSAYELGLLHIQRALFFTGSNVMYYYYSSNENPSNNMQVMCYRFSNALYNTYLLKENTLRVRAIRAF